MTDRDTLKRAAELLRNGALGESTFADYEDRQSIAAALDRVAEQEPVFYYRPRTDGGYEGPIHASAIERVRVESGAWHSLYAAPVAPVAPADDARDACGRMPDDLLRELAKERGCVMVPRDVVHFLNGSGDLEGCWFGESHPTLKGAFWWRKWLAAAETPEKEDDHE